MARKAPGSNGHTVARVPIALLYTRVSSDEQATEGLSLPAQLADCRRYAADRAWMIGTEYQDVLTGSRDDRPAYQALLAEVRRLRAEGQPAVVVVKWLHRFGRRVLERARSAEELKALGVPIHSAAEGGEVPELVANILASVAQEEVRQLSERVSAVRQHVVENGWTFPGKCAFGYRWRPATAEERQQGAPKSVLEVDPDRLPYYLEACQQALGGASIRAVARWIQSLPADVRGDCHYNSTAVRKLLMSPLYISRPNHGDPDVLQRPRCRWPSLLDDETWTKMQAALAAYVHMPKQASGRYLLTGLIRCPKCGARMNGHYTINGLRNKRYGRYICGAESAGAAANVPMCSHSCMTGAVDAAALAEVGGLIDTLASSLLADLEAAWRQLSQPEVADDIARRRASLTRQLEKARQRLTTAARMLVDGDIDKVGYELLREEARRDFNAAEAELLQLPGAQPTAPSLPPLREVLALTGTWAKRFQDADIPSRREVLGLLIDHVVPVRIGWGKYVVDVNWTPLGASLKALAASSQKAD